jgi:hypothetical protein
MDNPVDFLSICRSNFYACFFENLFKMSEVACHGRTLLTKCAGDFVNFTLQFGVTNATGVSISIPTLNRGFIRIMG